MLPKRILVPTDLDEGALEALDVACDLGRPFGATIYLVNAVTLTALGVPELGMALTGAALDGMIADNQRALDKLVAERKGKATFAQPLVASGDPVSVIVDTATQFAIDMIVMTTHGRRGVSRMLLGSVTERVVRSAPCPVLTVRFHAHEAAA